MQDEIWTNCAGFEGYYEVSSFGRIRSVSRIVKCSDGRNRTITQKILAQQNAKGYRKVTLKVNGEKYDKKVHRLVAQTFIDNPENKYAVNHIDGNKCNNNVSNLEWVTKSENEKHAYATGLKVSTEYHRKRTSECNKERRTLSKDTVLAIRAATLSQAVISRQHGISRSMVGLIRQGLRYGDIQ